MASASSATCASDGYETHSKGSLEKGVMESEPRKKKQSAAIRGQSNPYKTLAKHEKMKRKKQLICQAS
jgi:hypothetical protein